MVQQLVCDGFERFRGGSIWHSIIDDAAVLFLSMLMAAQGGGIFLSSTSEELNNFYGCRGDTVVG